MVRMNRLRSIVSKLPGVSNHADTTTDKMTNTEGDEEGVESAAVPLDKRDGSDTASSTDSEALETPDELMVPPASDLVTPIPPEVIRVAADPSRLSDDDPSVVEVLNRVQEFFAEQIKGDGPFLGAWLSAFADDRQLAEPITQEEDEVFVMVEGERLAELGDVLGVSPGAIRVVRDVHAGYAEVNDLVEYTLAMGVLCIGIPDGHSITEDEEAVHGLGNGAAADVDTT